MRGGLHRAAPTVAGCKAPRPQRRGRLAVPQAWALARAVKWPRPVSGDHDQEPRRFEATPELLGLLVEVLLLATILSAFGYL